MKDTRSYISRKSDAVLRSALWHNHLGHPENIYVSEYPRSGGTWFAQMLSELSQLPFPRNSNVGQQPCILHGHHMTFRHPLRTVHILRDGRDVIVSAYFYFLLNNEVSEALRKRWQKKIDGENYTNVAEHLPQFIRAIFSDYRVGFKKVCWSHFVNKYLNDPQVLTVKFEDLKENPLHVMRHALLWLDIDRTDDIIQTIIDKYQFKSQSGREPGEEKHITFLRKGIVGDWKNYFNKESAEVFNFYAGDALISAGYENEKGWFK